MVGGNVSTTTSSDIDNVGDASNDQNVVKLIALAVLARETKLEISAMNDKIHGVPK